MFSPAPPKRCPKVCPYLYDPVCTDNGKTYDNECLFESAKLCEDVEPMTIVHRGACKAEVLEPEPGFPDATGPAVDFSMY